MCHLGRLRFFLTTFHTTSTHTKTNIPCFSWKVKGHDCAIQYFTGTARSAHSMNAFFYVTSCFPTNNANNLANNLACKVIHNYINVTFFHILFPSPDNFRLISLTVVRILLLESFALFVDFMDSNSFMKFKRSSTNIISLDVCACEIISPKQGSP